MSDTFIFQHLGLGDHIVCNGLIRELTKKHGKLIMFVKEHNFTTVSNMFGDLNIGYVVGKSDGDIVNYISANNPQPLLKIGHERLDLKKNFDRSFYEESGVDFETRWSSWNIPRNLEREESLYNHFGLKDKDYVFVHDDNRFAIKPEFLPKDILIIKPHPSITPNLFDYLTIIERAKEIHCIASTFMFVVDSIKTCDNITVHRYMRTGPTWCEPTLKKNWKIIQ
jgi:hypothetical protein